MHITIMQIVLGMDNKVGQITMRVQSMPPSPLAPSRRNSGAGLWPAREVAEGAQEELDQPGVELQEVLWWPQ